MDFFTKQTIQRISNAIYESRYKTTALRDIRTIVLPWPLTDLPLIFIGPNILVMVDIFKRTAHFYQQANINQGGVCLFNVEPFLIQPVELAGIAFIEWLESQQNQPQEQV